MRVKVGWYWAHLAHIDTKCLLVLAKFFAVCYVSYFVLGCTIPRLVVLLVVYQFGVFFQMSASLTQIVVLLFKICCLTKIK
uniref:Uncharacterized protein n=1 Tax=Aegilops tauschii subsp. strangulata TaxID=200361 RepID=A0A453KPD4_AEGTS